jgi:hypothetical protein
MDTTPGKVLELQHYGCRTGRAPRVSGPGLLRVQPLGVGGAVMRMVCQRGFGCTGQLVATLAPQARIDRK